MSLVVTVLTPIPSPYQVELWDAVARHGQVRPRVVYVSHTHPDRRWARATPAHDHMILDSSPGEERRAFKWVVEADLLVASWYADRRVRRLLSARVAERKPWVYWGERPGFSRWRLPGRVRRWWHLTPLRRCLAPIWGIGGWAVEGWRREFGDRRKYACVPYFSDLSRFAPARPRPPVERRALRFLFSGSLILRKGVDLLANAFAELAAAGRPVELELLGAGDLEADLRRRLSRFGDRVRFAGFVQWRDLPAAYHRADVLVAPSRYEGWGLIVPEGLAAGMPVIATDRMGAARDLVRPGANGWIVPAGSGSGLRTALAEAADLSAERLAAMSAAATASVSQHQLGDGVDRVVAACQSAVEPGEWNR
jgi:glycosyltransferase involved in cell wall biosynthesis